ncbi:hypothetical protein [Jatrophihabitans sp.]|jgi:hypothetical protein|uniref:hypothetical protein n=1 Tax=Jatrophihabitans sp. TaxID=1932789 RepID=UPI002EFFBBDA
MGRDDAYADDIDWLDVDSDATGGTGPPRRPWPRWLTLTVTGVVVAVVVGFMNLARRDPTASSARPVPTPPASSTRPAPETSAAVPAQPLVPAVSVTELGHPLLGVKAGWELVGRGPDELVRIQPAAGRIISTALPDLRSGGPVYLLAGPDRVIVRPLDRVPAYVVADGQTAAELSPLLNEDGPAFPGPKPGQMWVRPADDHQPVMALATLDGKRLADFVPVPSGSSTFDAIADGAGYLLFPGIGGLYQARPEGMRRISTGALLAAGPTGWLVIECDERYRCQTVLISRADGRRKTVADRALGRDSPRGVISPDGSTVAVLTSRPEGTVEVAVLDVARGSWLRVVNLAVTQATLDGALAFSPDGKWLFAVTAGGSIAVINPRTSTASILDVPIPVLNQLVVRPATRAEPAPGARTAVSAADKVVSPDVAAALTPTCCRPTPDE